MLYLYFFKERILAIIFISLAIAFFPFLIVLYLFGAHYLYFPWIRLGLILLGIGMYLFFNLARKKYTKRHEWFDDLALMQNNFGGTTYYSKISYDNAGTIAALHLSIEEIYGYDFSFKFESRFERFFKSFGWSTECQSGKKKFDAMIYVISDDSSLCIKLKQNETLREAIYTLFSFARLQGIEIKKVECFDGRLVLEAKNKNNHLDDTQAKSFFQNSIPHLQNIATFFPSKESKNTPIYREKSAKIGFIFRVFAIALLLNALIIFFLDLQHIQPLPKLLEPMHLFPHAFVITSSIVLLLLTLAFLYLRKSSRFSPVLLEIFTLGTLSIFLSSIIELREFNIYLDRSSPELHHVKVLKKVKQRGSRGPSKYYLFLSNFNGENQERRIGVTNSFYNQVTEGSILDLYLYQGFFEYPWIDIKHQTTPTI
jgi:hypothetical protein